MNRSLGFHGSCCSNEGNILGMHSVQRESVLKFQRIILLPSSGWLHPAQGDAEVIQMKGCVSYTGQFWGVLITQFWKGGEGTEFVPSQQGFRVPRRAFFRVNKRRCAVGKMKVTNFICMGLVIRAGDVASGGSDFNSWIIPAAFFLVRKRMGHLLVTLSLSHHGTWQSTGWGISRLTPLYPTNGLSYAPGSQYTLYTQPLYTASQVRTTSRSWDKGVLTDLCLTRVLTNLCLTLYIMNMLTYPEDHHQKTQHNITS